MPDDIAPINMDLVAELVRKAGYYAYVEHTGGGCATIYAYRMRDGVPGDEPDVMAGPGVFSDFAEGNYDDFYIGRTSIDAAKMEWGDDDYQTDHVSEWTGRETMQLVADVIVRQLEAATRDFGPRTNPYTLEHPRQIGFRGVQCLIGKDGNVWRYKVAAEAQDRWSIGYGTFDAVRAAASAAAAVYGG